MEQKLGRVPAMAATAVLAAAAFFLRLNQLNKAFDESGMLTGKGVWLFSVVTILALVLAALYSRTLRGRKKFAAITGTAAPLLILGCAAALLMAVGSLMLLFSPKQQGDVLVALGGLLTALCWIASAMSRFNGKQPHVVLYLLPVVFYVVNLVCQFRFWSRDPVILDYCYELGALICILFAVFHLCGFCFDKGSRRAAVFFSIGGIFFAAASVAKASVVDLTTYLAAILWLGSHLWLLLRPKQR